MNDIEAFKEWFQSEVSSRRLYVSDEEGAWAAWQKCHKEARDHITLFDDGGSVCSHESLIEFARALLQSTPTASDSATVSGNECRPTWHEDEGEMGEQAIRCTTCGTYKGAMCRLAGRAAS